MKKILITAILAVAALATASAQQYDTTRLYSQGTNAFAGSATVTPNAAITLTKNSNIAVALTAASTAGAGSAVTATFQTSLDGTTWETTGTRTLAVTANGTNAVTSVTNFPVGGIGYLRLATIANGQTNALNSVTVTAVKKPGN